VIEFSDIDDDLKEYDLEHYDDDIEDGRDGELMGMFGNVKSLAYYESNAEDPYITLQEVGTFSAVVWYGDS
jgi:periodic tryptophan protein 1